MTKWTGLIGTLATTLLVAFLVVGLVGCQQQTDKTKEAPCDKPGEKAKAPAKAEPAKPMPPATPAPAPAKPAQPTPPPTNPPAQTQDKRTEISDQLYATMRVKMEQMIVERASLLKSGKTSNDPEVARLEGSILKARNLLTEAGETVGPIEPPIKEPPAPPK